MSCGYGSVSRIRSVRKRFVIHLLLGRLLDCPFHMSAENIRRNYPEFERELNGKTPQARDRDLESKFIGQVSGRLGEGFGPLVTSSLRKRPYLSRRLDRSTRTYAVKLERGLVVLKLRDSSFATLTRQTTLSAPTCWEDDIYAISKRLLCALPSRHIRLIGVGVAGLTRKGAGDQLCLFDSAAQKRLQITQAVDRIRDRYGEAAILRATLAKGLRSADWIGFWHDILGGC